MTTRDFVRKWGKKVKGDWWLKDAERCYWAASFRMCHDDLVLMSRDFIDLRNFDVYRGTEVSRKAYDIAAENF